MTRRYVSLIGFAVAMFVLIVAVAPPAQAQYQSVRVQVIDRGQADGIVIRTPNGHWVVIDGGSRDNHQVNAMRDDWGVDDVDLLIVTHRHSDHHGGIPAILRAVDRGVHVRIVNGW